MHLRGFNTGRVTWRGSRVLPGVSATAAESYTRSRLAIYYITALKVQLIMYNKHLVYKKRAYVKRGETYSHCMHIRAARSIVMRNIWGIFHTRIAKTAPASSSGIRCSDLDADRGAARMGAPRPAVRVVRHVENLSDLDWRRRVIWVTQIQRIRYREDTITLYPQY